MDQRSNADAPEGGGGVIVGNSNSWTWFLLKAVLMLIVLQYLFANTGTRTDIVTGTDAAITRGGGSSNSGDSAPVADTKKSAHTPLWGMGSRMELYVYVRESDTFSFAVDDSRGGGDISTKSRKKLLPTSRESESSQNTMVDVPVSYVDGDNVGHPTLPVWFESDLIFNMNDGINTRGSSINLTIPQAVQRNGTLFTHLFLSRNGSPINPSHSQYRREDVIVLSHALVEYRKRPQKTRNLWSADESEQGSSEHSPPSASSSSSLVLSSDDNVKELADVNEIVSYWRPNLTIALVSDGATFPRGTLPPHMIDKMHFTHSGHFYPILFFNDFWLLSEHLIPINTSTPSLELHLSYYHISTLKWQFYVQMEESFRMQARMGMTQGHKEMDDIKRMLSDTSPYLLALTVVVSLLHMSFDMLAFKNDISFWKNRKSMNGLSVRSILLNTFFQVVIFLYLLDNDTSWMIVVSSGFGCLIELWKVSKAVIIKLTWKKGWIPWLSYDHRESYNMSKTREYDDIAMRKLSYVLIPLVIGYAIYALMYNEYKSWYSWLLSSLVGCVYMFGFIMMTPQLFINYKMKSVAHLPWRVFMYKAFNTFIDDLFAFIITMPTMHRISCLRDDLVFFVYLYQRWIYPTDKNRMTEYGVTGHEIEENERKKKNGADDGGGGDGSSGGGERDGDGGVDDSRDNIGGTGGDDASEVILSDGDRSNGKVRNRKTKR